MHRFATMAVASLAVAFVCLGAALLVVTGWMGGEMGSRPVTRQITAGLSRHC